MIQRNGTRGHCTPTAGGQNELPHERPDWDCDPEEEQGHLERHRAELYKVSRGGPKSYENRKTLRSDSKGERITL